MKKAFCSIVAIFLIVLLISCNNKVNNEDFDELIENDSYKIYKAKEGKEEYIKKYDNTNRKKILVTMHEMANTKVEATEVWGEEEITEEKVNLLIIKVVASDFEDEHTLLSILKKWKYEDFSSADIDHNYVWEQLGGTVGRATGVKP